MGKLQPATAVNGVPEQQQIDVDRPGTVARTTGRATQLTLDRLDLCQQGGGGELGLHPQAGVEEGGLI